MEQILRYSLNQLSLDFINKDNWSLYANLRTAYNIIQQYPEYLSTYEVADKVFSSAYEYLSGYYDNWLDDHNYVFTESNYADPQFIEFLASQYYIEKPTKPDEIIYTKIGELYYELTSEIYSRIGDRLHILARNVPPSNTRKRTRI